MSVGQAMVRGYNFFVVAFLGIVGGSLVTELFLESEWLFRVDELLIIAIAAMAIVWYLVGQHRLTRSIVPVLLTICALAAKVFGLVLEIKDSSDVGDDIGIVQMLILFTIVAVVTYISMRRQVSRLGIQEKAQEPGREMQAIR
jgi:hypothetical protein